MCFFLTQISQTRLKNPRWWCSFPALKGLNHPTCTGSRSISSTKQYKAWSFHIEMRRVSWWLVPCMCSSVQLRDDGELLCVCGDAHQNQPAEVPECLGHSRVQLHGLLWIRRAERSNYIQNITYQSVHWVRKQRRRNTVDNGIIQFALTNGYKYQ